MKEYFVTQVEVWNQEFRVMAESEADAITKVKAGEGEFGDCFEYVETLDVLIKD